jgi:serine/threonine-protein kinase
MAYVPSEAAMPQRSLVWVDRQGREEPVGAPPRAYQIARIAPDGTRIALDSADQDRDIWMWDTTRRTLTRLTFEPIADERPVWTPDGRHIIFGSNRSGALNLFWRAADGSGTDQRITSSPNPQVVTEIAADGSTAFGVEYRLDTRSNIVLWRIGRDPGALSRAKSDRGSIPSEPLLEGPFEQTNPAMSRDGRYLAYQSRESGQFEVYVRPYPKINDRRWPVSTGGGTRPLWAPNGRELFYVGMDGSLMAVPVQTSGATFSAGNPTQIIQTRYGTPLPDRSYDISPDGKRFLMIKEADDKSTGIVVVQNWLEELKRAVPASAR